MPDLRLLLDMAPPAPWRVEHGRWIADHVSFGIAEFNPHRDALADAGTTSNAGTIAALRNAAPYLLDVTDAARALVAVSQPVVAASMADMPTEEQWSAFDGAADVASAALAALDAHLAGDR